MAVVLACAWPAAAAAAPTVTEYTGGVTPGFTTTSGPAHITVGPDGNIWFTESKSPGRVARITPTGQVTEFTGAITPGSGPNGIAARGSVDGNIWFIETQDPGRVVRMNPSGDMTVFTGGVTSGFSLNGFPIEIVGGPDGAMWFTELLGGRVARIDSVGQVTEFTTGITPNSRPVGIAAGPDGAMWFTEDADPGRVARITTSGQVTEFTGGITPGFSAGGTPTSIAAGPDGAMWFTESHDPGRVARITTSGQVTEFTTGITPNSHPNEIAAGPDGNVWFTEPNDPGRVARITPTGQVREFTGGVTPGYSANGSPFGITAGPDGAMWFTEINGVGRVVRITVGPGVTTGQASGIAPTSATLAGSVLPNGQTTNSHFEYGTTAAYGSETASAGAGAGLASMPVAAGVTGLAPNTLYHYRLVASNDSDTGLGFDRTFTTPQAQGPPPPGGATAATASSLRIVPRTFPAATRGPSARNAAQRTGARVSYQLNIAASVRFTVQRPRPGRRVGRRCVAPTRGNGHRPRCRRYVTRRGSFTRAGGSGINSFRFTGRLRGKRLRPARYRLVATPRAGGRTGNATRAAFRIIR